MKSKVDLSVIITAHHEGLVIHKTIKSVLNSAQVLTDNNATYEIIIHVDNGDDATQQYLEKYKKDKSFIIYKNSFGDPGLSRNFAIQKAKGKYVTTLDGDDLISKNWLSDALKIAQEHNGPILVHPEANLTFGVGLKNHVLWLQKPSFKKEKDAFLLAGANRWSSVCLGKKEIFLQHPYPASGQGYGHEDYFFNMETIASGVEHTIAPSTVQFYRREADSVLSQGNALHVVQPYTRLLDIEDVKKMNVPEEFYQKSKRSTKDQMRSVYIKARNNKYLNAMITPIAEVMKRKTGRTIGQRIPKFVFQAWQEINQIETQLYPTEYAVNHVSGYDSESASISSGVGAAYFKLAKSVTKLPDYIFLVPWLIRGGADKVVLNYIKAFSQAHPEWHIAIITTIDSDNEWERLLPQNVDLINFGNVSAPMGGDETDLLLSRLIIQLKCKRLHIINSGYGYHWTMIHKDLIRNHYHLNASYFSFAYLPESNFKGIYDFANPCIFTNYDNINKVFTDNSTIIRSAVEKNAFDPKKFVVHYQPSDAKIQKAFMRAPHKPMKILWAGRICTPKIPEVLAEIGKKLDPREYQIDVFGYFYDDYKKDMFDKSPCIKFHGPYSGFDSLKTGDYDLFLYTSRSDGVPNVLLEAAAAGLPTIASDAGGVGEFIQDKKTGLLVKDNLTSDAYIEPIKYAHDHPDKMFEYVQNAQKLLKDRHSWDAFIKVVKRDIQ